MSKKRATKKKIFYTRRCQRQKNKSKRNEAKITETPKKNLPREQSPKLIQDVEKRNIETSKNLEQKLSPKKDHKENLTEYYSKMIYNDFDTYSSGLFENFQKEESNKENIVQINEEILLKFGLTKDLRKQALKYLADILKKYQIHNKFYFKTLSVFDSFLINFSKNNADDNKSMKDLFISKIDKTFSTTKLTVFILCCFYIVNQIYNNRNFELKCLVNLNDKKEFTYEELNNLVYEIIDVLNCEINILGIYDFINIFIFDLNKRITIITNDNIFLNCFNKNVFDLSMKLEQDISVNDILPSTKALGIIMFSI